MVEHEPHNLIGGCHLPEGPRSELCPRPRPWTRLGRGAHLPSPGARRLPRGSLWREQSLLMRSGLGICYRVFVKVDSGLARCCGGGERVETGRTVTTTRFLPPRSCGCGGESHELDLGPVRQLEREAVKQGGDVSLRPSLWRHRGRRESSAAALPRRGPWEKGGLCRRPRSGVSGGREARSARTGPHVAGAWLWMAKQVEWGRWSPKSFKRPFKTSKLLCDSCGSAGRTGRGSQGIVGTTQGAGTARTGVANTHPGPALPRHRQVQRWVWNRGRCRRTSSRPRFL